MLAGLLSRAKDGEGVKSGPIGLAVILLLCVAVYFLFKSMSKHLKRVREEFPTDVPKGSQRPDDVRVQPRDSAHPADTDPAASPGAVAPPTTDSP